MSIHPYNLKSNKKPTKWLGQANAAPLNFDPKPSEAAFLIDFFQVSINADRR